MNRSEQIVKKKTVIIYLKELQPTSSLVYILKNFTLLALCYCSYQIIVKDRSGSWRKYKG